MSDDEYYLDEDLTDEQDQKKMEPLNNCFLQNGDIFWGVGEGNETNTDNYV